MSPGKYTIHKLLLCITVSLQSKIILLCRCSSHTNIIPFTVIVEFQSQSRNNLRENTCRCLIIHECCSWVNNTIISLSEWLEGSKANDKTPHRAAWGAMGARCGSYAPLLLCYTTTVPPLRVQQSLAAVFVNGGPQSATGEATHSMS